MYSKYEKPVIICSIFYYDLEYKKETGEQVINILEKYNMYPPEKFYAGKITKNKFIYANNLTKELLIDAYSEKDVFGIDMASGNSRRVTDYWRVEWDWTFYKNSKLAVEPVFKPWNVLSIHSTYGRLNNSNIYKAFFSCIKELIEVLTPFYASIDDVSNKVTLMNKTKERYFIPERIQEIYWGNYFGEEHCDYYGLEKLKSIPAVHVEKLGKGIYFSLTDNVFEFDSLECKLLRRKIKNYLK